MLARDEPIRYLILWENVHQEVTRVLLNKRLFGYTNSNGFHPGAMQKFGCQRLSKGCISVPAENLKQVFEIFVTLNVPIKVREVVDFGEKAFA